MSSQRAKENTRRRRPRLLQPGTCQLQGRLKWETVPPARLPLTDSEAPVPGRDTLSIQKERTNPPTPVPPQSWGVWAGLAEKRPARDGCECFLQGGPWGQSCVPAWALPAALDFLPGVRVPHPTSQGGGGGLR